MADFPDHVVVCNKLRIDNLLAMGIDILAEIFRKRYKILTQKDWSDTPNCAKDFFCEKNSIGKYIFDNAYKLEKQKLRNGNLRAWDYTILKKVINALARENNRLHADGWRDEIKKIQDLVNVRNEVAHATATPEIFQGKKFEKLCHKLEQALIALGGSKNEIFKIQSVISAKKSNIFFICEFFILAFQLSKHTGLVFWRKFLLNYGLRLAWSLLGNIFRCALYVTGTLLLSAIWNQKFPFRAKYLMAVVFITAITTVYWNGYYLYSQILVFFSAAVADILYRRVRAYIYHCRTILLRFGRKVKDVILCSLFVVSLIVFFTTETKRQQGNVNNGSLELHDEPNCQSRAYS